MMNSMMSVDVVICPDHKVQPPTVLQEPEAKTTYSSDPGTVWPTTAAHLCAGLPASFQLNTLIGERDNPSRAPLREA
ncbi:hypothetical protein TIFTF001_038064 [Ficus carica]|uniref:Uncharacterized protein n=1 Tax=Ficus carica TaxID=3494 RepID=A0AA88E859_FICCA|nr:hypothetical protein TIFTF001_038064 [Ficus carica]